MKFYLYFTLRFLSVSNITFSLNFPVQDFGPLFHKYLLPIEF